MDKQALRALAALACASAPVRKIETGASAGLSASEWRDIVRAPRASAISASDAERISERRRELAHDFAFVGDRQAAIDAASGAFDE